MVEKAQMEGYPDERAALREYENLKATMRRYNAFGYAATAIFLAGVFVTSAILIPKIGGLDRLPDFIAYLVAMTAILVCSWVWFVGMHLRRRARVTIMYERLEELAKLPGLPEPSVAAWSPDGTAMLGTIVSVMTVAYVVAIALAAYRFLPPDGQERDLTPTPGDTTAVVVPSRAPTITPPTRESAPWPSRGLFVTAIVVFIVLLVGSWTLAFIGVRYYDVPRMSLQRITVTTTVSISIIFAVSLAIPLAIKFSFDLVPELKILLAQTTTPEVTETQVPPTCSPILVTCEPPLAPPCECTQTCKPIVRPASCPPAPPCPACPACPACPVPSCVPSPTPTCPPCITQIPPPAADDDP